MNVSQVIAVSHIYYDGHKSLPIYKVALYRLQVYLLEARKIKLD